MKITKLQNQDFEKMFDIMQQAFPPAEYRPKEKQYAILSDPNYSNNVLKENCEILAFIATWKLPKFIFAEHFAVLKELRGQGIGSEFLKTYINTLDLPLVLEVENLSDTISLKRIEFYKRLGFILTDICYDQPNFQKYSTKIPLRIMYHPNGRQLDLNIVKPDIFTNIYKKTLNGDNIENVQ